MADETTDDVYKNYKCGNTQSRFTPDPGLVEGPVACGVCGTEMECKRDCYGPRGWVMAMTGSKQAYDSFTCPHVKEVWHRQVIALRNKARETCSGRLAKMFLEEANDVVTSRMPTKDDGTWRYFS